MYICIFVYISIFHLYGHAFGCWHNAFQCFCARPCEIMTPGYILDRLGSSFTDRARFDWVLWDVSAEALGCSLGVSKGIKNMLVFGILSA